MNIMPSYISQTHIKVLLKPQGKSFDIRKKNKYRHLLWQAVSNMLAHILSDGSKKIVSGLQ